MCEGERFRECQTAKFVNSHIYILGILNEIDNHAMEICKAKDCLMISSTADFINKIISHILERRRLKLLKTMVNKIDSGRDFIDEVSDVYCSRLGFYRGG